MDSKLLVQMTESELKELIAEAVKTSLGDLNQPQKEQEEWLKGIEGIKQIFKVGNNKAIEIKNSGVIDEALCYTGPRAFEVHARKAKELWKQHYDLVKHGVII